MNVFVTIWNRYTWAIPLLADFKKAGLNPIIIDNNSTYPPCVEWLKNCPYKVHHREQNDGAWAFFITELYQQYRERYFMISDSDQDISQLPDDWVRVLMNGLLETDDHVWKSGLSQKIDDLPDNPYANEIREYEKNFYTNKNQFGYYKVWMDLGIAIYDRERRGEYPNKEANWYCAVRSPEPYQSRHLDWYLTPELFRDEDVYYLDNTPEKHRGWLYNWRSKYGVTV
jgi:hypothetical protein